MVKKIFFVSFIVFSVSNIFSEEVSFNLYANKNSVGVNEYFQISVEIQNATGGVTYQGIENLSEYIDMSQTGNMSSFSIVNGKMTSSQTIVFATQISKEGKYDIGPFLFNIGGKIYKTEILTINVGKGDDVTETKKEEDSEVKKTKSQNVNDFQDFSTANNNLNYMIKVEFSKKEAYTNDYIDAEVKLYTRDELQVINYEPLKFPSQAWSENFEIKTNYVGRTRINNLVYNEYIVEKKRFFISKEGTYLIEPAILNFNGLVGKGFFSYPERMTLSTKEEKIVIKSLPESNSKNFYGLVGNFTYSSSLSPSTIKEKEAATLTITVSGSGNMQNLKDIKYSISGNGVEVYSSKSNVSDSGNTKTKIWEILLVGQKSGNYKIELDSFTFFNPDTGSYKNIQGKSYTLSVVENDKSKEDSTIVIHSDEKEGQKENLVDINYIKLNIGNKRDFLNYNLVFRLLITLYLVLIVIIAIFLFVKYTSFNLYKNSSILKIKNAYKNFNLRIDKITKTINKSFDDKIIDSISNITENYFIDKFNIDSVEFTKTNIKEKLNRYLNETQISNLTSIFSNIDFMRFGGTTINKENILELIKNITTLVKDIEEANK
ncbi:MAG TPA: BatD family protein [Spirochaetota bacterium]|nr:BatD family protein [Spirochaetota bacterium]